jgi:hypothetical protein
VEYWNIESENENFAKTHHSKIPFFQYSKWGEARYLKAILGEDPNGQNRCVD